MKDLEARLERCSSDCDEFRPLEVPMALAQLTRQHHTAVQALCVCTSSMTGPGHRATAGTSDQQRVWAGRVHIRPVRADSLWWGRCGTL